MTQIIATFIALLHMYVFFLESIDWGSKRTLRIFGVGPEAAATTRLIAFNQGFYNLFLALAIAAGLIRSEWKILVDYAVLSVLGAGVVLFISERKLWRPALLQALPALLYLVLRLI